MPKLKQYRLLAAQSGAAAVLAVTIAAFGCTTNRTTGNGDPVTAPGAGVSTPATAPNTGSSSGTNPGTQAMDRLVTTREEAMQIMARHQQPRGVVLGPVDPVPTPGRGAEVPPTGQFSWPALQTNPQVTVNSSVSSPPVPAISSGAGEPVGGGVAVAAAANALAGGTAGMTTPPAGGAVFAPVTTTPTTAAIPVSPGALAGTTTVLTPAASPALTGTTLATAGTPTPTMSVAGLPPTTAASAGGTTPLVTAASAAPFGGRAAALAQSSSSSGPLRVMTDGNGSVVVTNQARGRSASTTSATGARRR